MTRSTNMEHAEVLDRLRGVLEHGKMGDKCLIATDLVTAAIASLSAPQPPAEAQRCTCPSGDGSLRWPCPANPPEAQPVAWMLVEEDGNVEYSGHDQFSFGRRGGTPLYAHPPPERARGGGEGGAGAGLEEASRAAGGGVAGNRERSPRLREGCGLRLPARPRSGGGQWLI